MTNTDSDRSFLVKVAEGVETHWREAGYVLIPIVGGLIVGILFSLQYNCSGWVAFALTIVLTIVFLVLYFRHRPTIAKLNLSIQSLKTSLENEGMRYATLEQNYAESELRNQQFRRFLLKILATDLNFGNNHRISVYIYQDDGFVNYCRYSSNPLYTKPGRPIIPKDESVLKEAWENGRAIGKGAGHKRRGPKVNKAQSYVYTMKSMNLLGLRIKSLDPLNHLGVVIFESTKNDQLDSEKNIQIIEKHIDLLRYILSDVDK